MFYDEFLCSTEIILHEINHKSYDHWMKEKVDWNEYFQTRLIGSLEKHQLRLSVFQIVFHQIVLEQDQFSISSV